MLFTPVKRKEEEDNKLTMENMLTSRFKIMNKKIYIFKILGWLISAFFFIKNIKKRSLNILWRFKLIQFYITTSKSVVPAMGGHAYLKSYQMCCQISKGFPYRNS